MTMKNPWAEIKKRASEIVPPVVMLREQAALLSEATDSRVEGEVRTPTSFGSIIHELRAVVPSLNNYSVTLLRLQHPELIYPVTLDAPWRAEPAIRCQNREEFEQSLLQLLSSEYVQDVVAALVAQARTA